MIRLFVGLSLPESVAERLHRLSGGVPGARWIDPTNMHVTLKFIGDVENGLAEDIDTALATVSGAPFDINLSGVGYFGKAKAARMLWAGVEPCEPLLRLQKKVETRLKDIGIPREERKFTPHVTVARLKQPPRERVAWFVSEHANFFDGPIPITRFTLFSSFLSSSGAIYTPEAEYPLNG